MNFDDRGNGRNQRQEKKKPSPKDSKRSTQPLQDLPELDESWKSQFLSARRADLDSPPSSAVSRAWSSPLSESSESDGTTTADRRVGPASSLDFWIIRSSLWEEPTEEEEEEEVGSRDLCRRRSRACPGRGPSSFKFDTAAPKFRLTRTLWRDG